MGTFEFVAGASAPGQADATEGVGEGFGAGDDGGGGGGGAVIGVHRGRDGGDRDDGEDRQVPPLGPVLPCRASSCPRVDESIACGVARAEAQPPGPSENDSERTARGRGPGSPILDVLSEDADQRGPRVQEDEDAQAEGPPEEGEPRAEAERRPLVSFGAGACTGSPRRTSRWSSVNSRRRMPSAMTVVVVATAPSTRYITAACTCTASIGSTPARISPVIAPGSAISPTAFVVSICGDERRAERLTTYGCAAVADG